MPLDLCDKRKEILAQEGHLLVLGGPGSGKTTIALLKAQRRFETLKPGQEILFLSFSRAAIRQVITKCRELLTREERHVVSVKTYHSFCLDLLQAHGRLLTGKSARFLFPRDERLRKSSRLGDWPTERSRLASSESLYCFDVVAEWTATLLERCKSVRELIADKFPLVIVDEFQDTDNDQWRIVRALTQDCEVFCLADPEQRIFDYRADVDPRRLDILRSEVKPKEFDLGSENYRSPNSTILEYAGAVLKNTSPLPTSADVKQVPYWSNAFAATVHASVTWTFSALRKKGIENPCVAVLCRSNSLVTDISMLLSEEHVYSGRRLTPIEHDVVWDAELSAAAGVAVASVLEWTSRMEGTLAHTLQCIARYYKLKNSEHPTNSAAESARKFEEAERSVTAGKVPRSAAAKALMAAHASATTPIGNPISDWRDGWRLFQEIPAISEIYREARLVRLFKATDALASALADCWVDNGSYAGASAIVRRILDQERLAGAESDHRGCILMNIHKAKGKEFDGVVVVEGAFKSRFFDDKSERPPFERSRRLLRVAFTRARSLVTIVRPRGAQPLVD